MKIYYNGYFDDHIHIFIGNFSKCHSAYYMQSRATPRRGPCESRQFCRGYPMPEQIFYKKCITRKCLTLKMKVNVTEYSDRNGFIRWQISTSIKVTLEHFSLALTVFQYSHLKFRDVENVGQCHDAHHLQWRRTMSNT